MRSFFLAATLALTCLCAHAQNKAQPFSIGITEQFKSAVLGQQRTLNIYLPDGFSKDSTYPVIYLLDGAANEDFVHVSGLAQFLNMIGYMPPTIIVGIANVDRVHDFTFPSDWEKNKEYFPSAVAQKRFSTSGGSAKFIAFVEKELVPYINKHYKVRTTTLIGQSLGGLMATQFLLEKPDLFNTFIIISPSLWWDKESLLTRAPQLLKTHETVSTTVYLSTGGLEEDVMQNDAKKLNDLLQQQKNFTVLYRPEAKESHLTILHNCLYNAFVKLNEKERK